MPPICSILRDAIRTRHQNFLLPLRLKLPIPSVLYISEAVYPVTQPYMGNTRLIAPKESAL